jgi:hypothetical protein
MLLFFAIFLLLFAALIGWIFVKRVRPLVHGQPASVPAGPSVAAPVLSLSTDALDVELPPMRIEPPIPSCPVCGAEARAYAEVDFNKSCSSQGAELFPFANHPVGYAQCSQCQYTFAPAFLKWSEAEFSRWIYNDKYFLADPDYAELRPEESAMSLTNLVGVHRATIRHLDLGGGDGQLAARLNTMGWRSVSYDPFANRDVALASLGRFELITLIAVLEHAPDPHLIMRTLMPLLETNGLVVISTGAFDKHVAEGNLDWPYAAPRAGHIGLYTKKSVAALAARYGLRHFASESSWHILTTATPPQWAKVMLP